MKCPQRGAYGKVPGKPKTLGQRIRLVRMTWKWSQTQLANALGTNQQTVSHWEQDCQQPTDATLHSLALLFGMTADALLSGKGFSIPDPPQTVGSLLVAANLATDLIKLPHASENEILLVRRSNENGKQLSPNEASRLIKQAHDNGQPVWIVV